MRARSWVLPVLLLSACNTRLCRDPTVWRLAEYTAPRIATPPVIDGKLDDAIWDKVPWTTDFWSSMGYSEPSHRTRAKIAWDDTNIYVAFEVEDNDIVTFDGKTHEPFNHDDDPLYTSEVVEIFLQPNHAGYNELELSPLNHKFDASFTGRRQGMNLAWDSGMQHAVQVNGTVNASNDADHGWTAEMAIPFAQLTATTHVPPQIGERWTFNLFRLDHGLGVGEEGQAFSPVMIGDFHNLPKYAALVFGGAP